MEYEIDFLPVGEESKGGDAICFRYWDANTPPFVGIIDGGTAAAGEKLVEHIQQYYGTKTVDLVINTHPHTDHTSGLYTVLEQLSVKHLMMHKPWEHAVALKALFHDGRITSTSIEERVRDALQPSSDRGGSDAQPARGCGPGRRIRPSAWRRVRLQRNRRRTQ